MESKKINQLATELTPALSDLTIIGDPTTGISKKITLSQMASLFTGTVEEYPNLASFPLVGTADTIYIALDTNVLYRWDTGLTSYVELSPNIINSLVFSDANGFDGNISLVGSVATLTITTALTTGSVPFIGASGALSQDNANLFFDDTNNRLGINTNAPTTSLDVFGSGIIGRLNGTSTNNSFLGFASAGTNRWSIGNVQSDHRFRIYNEATTSELVSILSTGEFGIGIANPTTKFHIDGAASALIANLDANVSVAKSVSFRSDNSNRFNIEVSGTESGSNAGADFFIRRYSDAGSLIDTPLTIIRSTGNATFSGILTTPQVKAATSAGLSINANSGTQVADFGAGGSANITFFGGLSGTSATFTNKLLVSSAGNAPSFTWSGINDLVVTNNLYASQALITNNSTLGNYSTYSIGKTRGTLASPTAVANGEIVGNVLFFGHDGTNYVSGNEIVATVDGTVASGIVPLSMTFRTRNASGTMADRLVLSANGNFGVGSGANERFGVTGTGGTTGFVRFTDGATAGMFFGVNSGDAFIHSNNSTLIFGASGSNTLGEKMRISSNGFFKASNTGTYQSPTIPVHELCSDQNYPVLRMNNSRTSGTEEMIRQNFSGYTPNNTSSWFIYSTDPNAVRFYVTSAGGIGNYQANNVNLSDERTKKDISPLESYWNKFKAIEIVKFKYKDQTHDDFNIGVIAQQVEKIAPEFIDIDGFQKPELDEEGNEIISEEEPLKSVYTADLHHATIKVLQEAMAKIELLEAKLNMN
jgi:hypothetical protein